MHQRLTRRLIAGCLLLAASWLLAGGCVSPYLDTVAPKDASFEVRCERRLCQTSADGSSGNDGLAQPSLIVEVSFADRLREYPVCCDQVPDLLLQLELINDMWCDDLTVPDKTIGELTIGTKQSDLTGAKGASIDDGQGYVTFNCDAWLPELIAQIKTGPCCSTISSR